MLGSPELVPAEVASETGADISGVAAVANRMARTLKELKETKDVEQAEVDQLHVIDQRKKVAFDFYKDQGFSNSDAALHIQGIDFNEPLTVVELKPGQIFQQWQLPITSQGNYYSELRVNPPSLGISPFALDRNTGVVVDKLPQVYKVSRPVKALKSTARSIIDTWSNPKEPFEAPGGATQYMTTDKDAFEESDND